jgi:hypothetical protein
MTVLVDRDAPGDLAAGVERRVVAADAVAAVESLDIRGVRPGLDDLRVSVRADLRVRVPDDGDPGDPATVAGRLSDAYGPWEVTVVE